jgi:hypothetical protein
MAGFLQKIKDLFSSKPKEHATTGRRISVAAMEAYYAEDNLSAAASTLRQLLELYGKQKNKNHRTKGREFIHFLLSSKHKDLKNEGYVHWQNVQKILRLTHNKVYPYHKQNLRLAMDFFKRELKSIQTIDTVEPQ